jgi:hypothetical protein
MSSQPSDIDDELLAVLLISTWMLASGRSLPPGVPVTELGVDELMEFWADDMSPPPGWHTSQEAA